MSTIKDKTVDEVSHEVDLFMYTTLIEMEAGSKLTEEDMCAALKTEFDVDITPDELRAHYEPTVAEMEEDYGLIYQHCVS